LVCSSCGTDNEVGRKFCKECGIRLVTGCPACGAANAPDAKFCGECGAALGARAGAATSAAASPPDARTSASDPASGRVAERRLVSVLFADLVGFTPFAEERDAEETRELLSRYFDLSRELIERYGGVVEKFIGDAVMAVWGAPIAREDDAERAVRAGLELVEAVRSLGPAIQARAGVLTGEAAVTLGAVGEGMVAGDLVNTAARLQSVAEPGTVLVGEETYRDAAAAVAFEAVGEAALKGKTSPVTAWRAMRVVAERGGRNRAGALEAPFVGRDTEFRLLKDLFHATGRERRPRLVSVTGQGGIGKSRLAWEFLKYIDGLLETVWWHSGRSPAYGEGITFWALGEMVRGRAGLVETDDEATTRTRIAETVARFVPDDTERRWIEGALLTLLGIEEGGGGSEQLFAAWRTFFERIAAQGTVVLVFEDLQWADPGQLDFIEHLMEWVRDAPIFVATLARPELLERRSDWGAGRRGSVTIGLEPLSDEAMRGLLEGLAPGLPDRAVATIVGRADGIPLYAVETVRMLVAEGRLVEEDGRYRPTGDLSTLAVPGTLQALIASRLDALPPADRALLQDAAVLGQSFTPAGLSAVSGPDPADLEPRLRGLVRRELLTQEADPRSPERGRYAFVQALIREVAYNTLARADRKNRHLAAARYFETLATDELAGALAAHYLAAQRNAAPGPEADALAAQARVALRGAADRAVTLGAHEQALTYLRQALEVTSDPAEEADLLERAGRSAVAAFRRDEAIALLERAVEVQRERGDRIGQVRALGALGQTLIESYRSEQAVSVLEAARTEFADLEGDPTFAALRAALSRAYFMHAEPERAILEADAALPVLERANVVSEIADTVVTKGSALATIGRMREGTVVLRGGLDLSRSNRLPATELRARINLSSILAYEDPRAGAEIGRDGMDLAARLGLRGRRRSLLVNAIGLTASVGDWDWCLAAAQEATADETDEQLRASGFAIDAFVRFARGMAGQAELDRFAASMEGEMDPNALANVADVRATLAVLEGRIQEAIDDWRMVARMDAFSAAPSLWVATDAALWLRDAPQAARILSGLEAIGVHGRFIDAVILGLHAGVAALEGRRADAVSGYRACLSEMRDLGLLFEEARVAMTAAITVGETGPEGRVFADRAREILGTLRATALLGRFEATLGAGDGGRTVDPADHPTGAGAPPVDPATSADGEPVERVG
jgi:class 3 adenylate cyclase/tetratricopeptide (TPR) repeat protein